MTLRGCRRAYACGPFSFSFNEEPALHAATMEALEFPKVRTELAAHASCQLGKELCLSLAPLPSLTQIKQAQREATEARAL